jgi:3-(3-hydroxy-phenyl)propionate hydroxylase
VTAVEKLTDGAVVTVETPDGNYRLTTDYLLACDGGKSFVRSALGLDFSGRPFEERFLIADVELKTATPEWSNPSR